MNMFDPYEVLGVHQHAGTDDIKRAYRRLVRECHPDLNPSPTAQRRFTQVSDAYAILSDARQRALFDEFGTAALEPGFDPQVARQYATRRRETASGADSPFGDMGAFHDVLGAAFHAPPPDETPRYRQSHKNPPEYAQVTLEPLATFIGGMTTVSVRRPSGRVDTLRIRVEAGAKTGDSLVLSGQGSAGRGEVPGDLHLDFVVPEHPHLKRCGLDLELDVPITLLEAVQGGPITVPTPTGLKRVNLPPNCANARLRLRGRGIQHRDTPGHLILHLRLALPAQVDSTVVEACRTIERSYEGDVRDRIRI